MSAEQSPILANTIALTGSIEQLDTQGPLKDNLSSNSIPGSRQNIETSAAEQSSPTPNLHDANKLETHTRHEDTPNVKNHNDEDELQIAQQRIDIAKLQKDILNEDFNINDLEATSSGTQDTYSAPLTSKTLSSPLYFEADLTDINIANDNLSEPTTSNSFLSSEISEDTPSNNPLEKGNTNKTYAGDESVSPSNTINAADSILSTEVNEDLLTSREGNFAPNIHIESGSATSEYGTLIYSEDGTWSYTLNNQSNSVQTLGSDQTVADKFSIVTKSGSELVFTINIHGTNDSAIITGDTHSDVSTLSNFESGERPETIAGKLQASDTDADQALFVANNEINSDYGQASISEDGEWRYELNSQLESVKNLTQGETLTDSFIVTTQDGTSQLINITILGADDKPILSGQNSESVDLQNSTTVGEKLHINDPDFGESSFVASTDIESANGYGTGSISENGEWSFTVNTDHSKVSSLEENGQLLDYFMVTTADGTEQSIIIRIQNGNETDLSTATASYDSTQNTLVSLIEESSEQLALDSLHFSDHEITVLEMTHKETAPPLLAVSDLDSSSIENQIMGTATNSFDII